MKVPMRIYWRCDECGHTTPIFVYPVIPGRFCGPPEDCYPDEGGEIDPDVCEECGAPVDYEMARELAENKYEDRRQVERD